jgi:hypothetical protein
VSEAALVADKLTELGGTSETHPVSDEAVEEAQKAAAAGEQTTHAPTYDEISERAYFISLEDEGGDEVKNWLQAERELTTA